MKLNKVVLNNRNWKITSLKVLGMFFLLILTQEASRAQSLIAINKINISLNGSEVLDTANMQSENGKLYIMIKNTTNDFVKLVECTGSQTRLVFSGKFSPLSAMKSFCVSPYGYFISGAFDSCVGIQTDINKKIALVRYDENSGLFSKEYEIPSARTDFAKKIKYSLNRVFLVNDTSVYTWSAWNFPKVNFLRMLSTGAGDKPLFNSGAYLVLGYDETKGNPRYLDSTGVLNQITLPHKILHLERHGFYNYALCKLAGKLGIYKYDFLLGKLDTLKGLSNQNITLNDTTYFSNRIGVIGDRPIILTTPINGNILAISNTGSTAWKKESGPISNSFIVSSNGATYAYDKSLNSLVYFSFVPNVVQRWSLDGNGNCKYYVGYLPLKNIFIKTVLNFDTIRSTTDDTGGISFTSTSGIHKFNCLSPNIQKQCFDTMTVDELKINKRDFLVQFKDSALFKFSITPRQALRFADSNIVYINTAKIGFANQYSVKLKLINKPGLKYLPYYKAGYLTMNKTSGDTVYSDNMDSSRFSPLKYAVICMVDTNYLKPGSKASIIAKVDASAGMVKYEQKADTMYSLISIGSAENNYKSGNPNGLVPLNQQKVKYSIHFQNPSNDTVLQVRIVDTISQMCNLDYIYVHGSSHPYRITAVNNILQITFNKINLPKVSEFQPENSRGWITFDIFLKSGLKEGVKVTNNALIYFDSIQNIYTNQAWIQFSRYASVKKPITQLGDIASVYPNPFNSGLNIQNNTTQKTSFQLMDMLGRNLQSGELPAMQKLELVTSGLKPGMYVLKIGSKSFRLIKE